MNAIIEVEKFGTIEVELNKDAAPITVDNFVKLVNKGFYNGLTFHRIIRGFMIQGGCPKGNGTGGPGYSIKGEFSMDPNSAGSQFFIMHQAAPHLDGQYAAFGKVIKGIEVVDAIASIQTNYFDAPLQKVVIKSIKIKE